MILEDHLQQFGLSPKQSLVYLAALKLGTSQPVKIAIEAHLNRSTTYIILRELAEQGLIMQSERHNKKTFTAVPPERLVSLMEFRAKQYTQMAEKARKILPELKSMMSSSVHTPKVQIYEGKKGIQSAYEDTLTSSETIKAYASVDDTEKTLPDYFPDYYKRRAKKGIHIDAIFPNTKMAVVLHKRDKEEDRTSLLVPIETYQFTPEINVYDNKVAFFSWRDQFAMIIESQELAEAQKKIFQLAWQEAQRLEKKHCPLHSKKHNRS
ncbi:MAG TPA: helix-turn-helix domain-containing protein [Patescibacteria group bacterium]|nr:helix-turn-helix domain-containing protein [Patescibacteria group bacterium]